MKSVIDILEYKVIELSFLLSPDAKLNKEADEYAEVFKDDYISFVSLTDSISPKVF